MSIMWQFLKSHEAFMRAELGQSLSPRAMRELAEFHEQQLGYLQHERLVHLIVMLFTGLFMLLSLGFAALHPSPGSGALALLLLGLLSGYLVHYFRMENGVQRLYEISRMLTLRRGRRGSAYGAPSNRGIGGS